MIFTMIVSACLGLFVGIVMAVTGAGATVLSLPLLVFAFNLSLPAAAPISLCAVMLSSILATILGLRRGLVRYRAAGLLIISGMLLAPAGVWLAHKLPDQALAVIFIVVMFVLAHRILVASKVKQSDLQVKDSDVFACTINPRTSSLFWTRSCVQRLVATGGLAGFLSGLLGIGGGFVIVPALYRVSNIESRMIVATSLAVVAATSTTSMLMYSAQGQMNWVVAVPFVLGTLLGVLSGRQVACKMPAYTGQRLFAFLTLFVALLFLAKLLIDFV